MKPRYAALFVVTICGALSASMAPALTLPDDGRAPDAALSSESAPPLARDEVPLPATPDWNSTLERAVGGLAWGDADGDGDLDLAAGCYYANAYPPITEWKVYIYVNHGGQLETEPSWISDDQRSTADVRWADIDGDGRPDLIAANGYASYDPSVVYFNGPGGLSTTPGWVAGDATWTLGAAAADMDGDGYLDVAFANQGRDTYDPYRPVTLFRNTGSTLETTPSWTSDDEAISNYVAWGDVNGSSLTELSEVFTGDGIRHAFHVSRLPMEEPITVWVDDAPVARFASERIAGWVSLPSAPPAGTAVEIRYRAPSAPDLAVSRWVNFTSGLYVHNGSTLDGLMGWSTGEPGRSDKGIGWADVDGDGDLDLAIGASSAPTVLYPNLAGSLGHTPVWEAEASYFGCQDLAWGDVDGDGDPDLATIHFGNGHARVYLNLGGVLSTTPSWTYDCSSSATAIAWGDVNGDGHLDLAVGTARQPVMVFLNTSPPADVAPGEKTRCLYLSAGAQPSRGGGEVRFVMPESGWARLRLHDASGRMIDELYNGRASSGEHRIARAGRSLPAGVYLLRLDTRSDRTQRRWVVVR